MRNALTIPARNSPGTSGFGKYYLFDIFDDGQSAIINVLEEPATGADQAGGVADTSMTVTVTVNRLES